MRHVGIDVLILPERQRGDLPATVRALTLQPAVFEIAQHLPLGFAQERGRLARRVDFVGDMIMRVSCLF